MKPVQARLAALLASYLAALLAARGLATLDAEGTALLARWLGDGFELALLLGYAVLHPRLQACRWPPFSTPAGSAAADEGGQP